MNAKVDWDDSARRVDIERGIIKINMTIDVKEIIVLNVKKAMDTAPIIQGGRTFVPLRFISEGLGASVEWEGATRTVRITDSGKDSYGIGYFNIEIEAGDYVSTTSDGTLLVSKKSGMIIYENFRSNGPTTLVIDIKVDSLNMDIPTQRKEAEALLRQRLSGGVVDEIMEYISAKNDRFTEIERKIIQDGNYQVIISGTIGPIRVRVYYD
jgi:hypothetical protein